MRVFASGWALQSPALNFFKKFLRSNPHVSLAGIVYPSKIPEDIEGVPVLDFDDARRTITPDDIVLNCNRSPIGDLSLYHTLVEFFASIGIELTEVNNFVSSLVEEDAKNLLRFPVEGVTSSDIRALRDQPRFSFTRGRFFDPVSFETAIALDDMARAPDWDRMLVFDQEPSPEHALSEAIAALLRMGVAPRFRVIGEATIFLNALLQLRMTQPEATLAVELSEPAGHTLGPRLDFYCRSLGIAEIPAVSGDTDAIFLGDADSVISAFQANGIISPAVFFMRRSIFDYRMLQGLAGSTAYRIMLRQPDTSPGSLIAGLLV